MSTTVDAPAPAPAAGRWVPGTTPYPWPWDGLLEPARLAVLVITTGTAGPGGPGSPAPALADLVGGVRAAGGLVVNITTLPPAARAGALAPATGEAPVLYPDDPIVRSAGTDGFFGSPLDALLRAGGRDQLLLCGWWLETSVHSTLRTANDQGLECLTVRDACVALAADVEPNAVSSIEMSGGIFGAVGLTSSVLQALSERGMS